MIVKEHTSPFDSDFETARMRLRNFAEDACKVLDARMLNLASFHLCAYMDFAAGHKGRLVKIMMREIEAEQRNAVTTREAKADASTKTLTKRRRIRRTKGE